MISMRLCVAIMLIVGFATVQAEERPNILFVIADDLGWADVGWHGSDIDTPHLDALAQGGVILDRHYVTPMCSSTRACLLSGRYATRFGLHGATNDLVFPLGMTTLASALQAVGYQTGLTGKWHLGSKAEWGPQRFGFDRSYGSFAGGVDQYLHLYKSGPYQVTWHRNHELLEEEGHATDLIAREAIRWIEGEQAFEQPWFIQVAFTAVHVPIQEPEEWVEPYADRIENESRRRFAGCATHMDHAIGEIVAALDRSGQREDTLILFTSDNGGSGPWSGIDKYPGKYDACPVLGLNDPLRGRKGSVYEGGVRVPAFAHWPGKIPANTRLTVPLHIIDWMPTLLALVGHEPKEDLNFDGIDVWPLLTGAQTEAPDRHLYFRKGDQIAIQKDNWKLLVSGKNRREIFQLEEDPNEERNLAREHPEKISELGAFVEREVDREQGARLAHPVP